MMIPLRNYISRMLQRDISSALTNDSKTMQKQVMKPISNFITQAAVRQIWDSIRPQDALQMLWHLPQEISTTVLASLHGPLVDLLYDLLSWSTSSVRIGIASGVPRYPLVLNINDPSTLTARYEASTIPVSNLPQLRNLMGDSELSWATAPPMCIPDRAPSTMMTPSQSWRCYSPSKVIEYLGHDIAFLVPMNFDIEPAEIPSTQSLADSVVQPSATPTSHEHHQDSAMVDLTVDPAALGSFADALLPKFDAVSQCSQD